MKLEELKHLDLIILDASSIKIGRQAKVGGPKYSDEDFYVAWYVKDVVSELLNFIKDRPVYISPLAHAEMFTRKLYRIPSRDESLVEVAEVLSDAAKLQNSIYEIMKERIIKPEEQDSRFTDISKKLNTGLSKVEKELGSVALFQSIDNNVGLITNNRLFGLTCQYTAKKQGLGLKRYYRTGIKRLGKADEV